MDHPKPKVLLAPYPRTLREIFDDEDLERLRSLAEVIWGVDEEATPEVIAEALPSLWAYVGSRIHLDRALLASAKNLRVIAETGGAFPATIDYDQCFSRGIRVLSCAPAFGRQVAEMALAMTLASGRGLIEAHVAFRRGQEAWFGDPVHSAFDADNPPEAEFTLFGRRIGMIGFGSLGRSLLPLLRPFGCDVRVFDPWLPSSVIRDAGCVPCDLDTVLSQSEVTHVLAVPTPENKGLIGARELALMPRSALLVVLSRAHLVDFDALLAALTSGRIRAAIDVFPEEPLPLDHPLRRVPNVILSAHRAASLLSERRAIGQMVVDDLEMMIRNLPPRRMQQAEPELVMRLRGS